MSADSAVDKKLVTVTAQATNTAAFIGAPPVMAIEICHRKDTTSVRNQAVIYSVHVAHTAPRPLCLDCRRKEFTKSIRWLSASKSLMHIEAKELRDPAVYSITSSARCRRCKGTLRPSAVAVLRFITSSNLTGAWTERSLGLSP